MKKNISLVVITLTLLTLLLSGCAVAEEMKQYHTPLYTVNVSGDNCYLTFDEAIEQVGDDMSDCEVLIFPEFLTLKDMRQGIITGAITERELISLNRFCGKNEDGSIKICNVDKLIECIIPSDLEVEKVIWKGEPYSFSIRGGPGPMFIQIVDEELYVSMMNSYHILYDGTATITAQEFEEERSATVYFETTPTGAKRKLICYEINDGTKTIMIQENYDLWNSSEKNTGSEVFDTKPGYIQIWIKDEIGYAYGYISGPEYRPSLEWLSQFGICEYVETEAA